MNNQWFSRVAVWLVIALVLFAVFKQFDRGVTQGSQIGYSDFLEEVRAKRIKAVTLQEGPGGGTEILAITNDDKRGLGRDEPNQLKVETIDVLELVYDHTVVSSLNHGPQWLVL